MSDSGLGVYAGVALIRSKNQDEWDAQEGLMSIFEKSLKEHNLYDQKVLFVDDEFERPPNAAPTQGWGETVAGSITAASHSLAKRLNAFTDSRTQKPGATAPPTAADEVSTSQTAPKPDAEGTWAQLNVAAKGLASAAGTFAGSLSTNAQKAYSHYSSGSKTETAAVASAHGESCPGGRH